MPACHARCRWIVPLVSILSLSRPLQAVGANTTTTDTSSTTGTTFTTTVTITTYTGNTTTSSATTHTATSTTTPTTTLTTDTTITHTTSTTTGTTTTGTTSTTATSTWTLGNITTTNTTTATTTATETLTTTSYYFAGNDPITKFGDVEREFWLPPDTLVLMLQTPHVHIFGSVFPAENNQQWFERFIVRNAGGRQVLSISIKKNIAEFNRTVHPPRDFETLDVRLRAAAPPLAALPPKLVAIDTDIFMYAFRVAQMGRRPSWDVKIGRAQRECVEVSCPSIRFAICSAPAREYYGMQRYLSVEYAHLDLLLLEMSGASDFEGVLPELWGTRPLSDETRAYTSPPSAPDDAGMQGNESAAEAGPAGQAREKRMSTCDAGGAEHLAIGACDPGPSDEDAVE